MIHTRRVWKYKLVRHPLNNAVEWPRATAISVNPLALCLRNCFQNRSNSLRNFVQLLDNGSVTPTFLQLLDIAQMQHPTTNHRYSPEETNFVAASFNQSQENARLDFKEIAQLVFAAWQEERRAHHVEWPERNYNSIRQKLASLLKQGDQRIPSTNHFGHETFLFSLFKVRLL